MLLWTMKPIEMWNELKETGVYHCDAGKFSMPEFRLHYDWLVEQMKKRIGAPPTGVELPVWAWYRRMGKEKSRICVQNDGHMDLVMKITSV